jgi:hypothetical protein
MISLVNPVEIPEVVTEELIESNTILLLWISMVQELPFNLTMLSSGPLSIQLSLKD